MRPAFNPVPIQLLMAAAQIQNDLKNISAQTAVSLAHERLKRLRVAELIADISTAHFEMVKSIADNPGVPYRIDINRPEILY